MRALCRFKKLGALSGSVQQCLSESHEAKAVGRIHRNTSLTSGDDSRWETAEASKRLK